MIFNFNYSNGFSISVEADNDEVARKSILNGVGKMEIENFGGLQEEYLELDYEYDYLPKSMKLQSQFMLNKLKLMQENLVLRIIEKGISIGNLITLEKDLA